MSCAADRPSTGWEMRIAPARVCFTRGAYFGFERNVSSVGPADSIPATPVISSCPSPLSSHPRVEASWESFIPLGYARLGRAVPVVGQNVPPLPMQHEVSKFPGFGFVGGRHQNSQFLHDGLVQAL